MQRYINSMMDKFSTHFVNIFDELIQIFIPSVGILVLEIFTHGHQHMVCLVVCGLIECCVHKSLHSFFDIVIEQVPVILYRGVRTRLIITKPAGRGIVIVKYSRKNVGILSQISASSPY